MEIDFRKAVKEDFGRLNELFEEMLRAVYEREDVTGYRDGDLDYYFAGGEDWICVAEIDGRVEAFLSVEVHREDGNYLYCDDFAVSRAYRGKGIGSALMEKAEEYCWELGLYTIILHVEETNANAREFYEKRGFTVQQTDGTRRRMVKCLREIDRAADRVRCMEMRFDMLQRAADADLTAFRSDVVLQEQLQVLAQYYESGQWLQDYELDEKGLLPPGLKRGVLAQDAVYYLLERVYSSSQDEEV